MRWTLIILCLYGISARSAGAQSPPATDDLAELQQALKTLKWQGVDVDQIDLRERCRALLFMSHALTEIGSADTAQADLLSEYLDQQNLGPGFAASTLPPETAQLSYVDGVKIVIALLQGPLAQSSWATELASVPPDMLVAYEKSYQSICQRKWAEVSEARQGLRRMSKFLKTQGKLQEFDAWLPGEVERRSHEHDAEMARRRATQVAEKKADEQRAADLRQAREQEQSAAAAQQMEAALRMDAALQTAQQAQSAPVIVDDDGWYSGWYYGALSNLRRGAWYRDAGNVGMARARTEQRVSNWHAGGGRRR